jgi:hypothetical protein
MVYNSDGQPVCRGTLVCRQFFFENVTNRTRRTVLVMAYPPGVPRRKKGWPPLVYKSKNLKS